MSPSVLLRDEQTKERAIARIRAIRPDQDNPMAVYIAPYKKIRSLEANALYWKLVGMVADATGHTRDTLHTFFKKSAFGVRVEEVGGELLEVIPSSASVSRGDFSQLIEHVQRFIAEHGIEESA